MKLLNLAQYKANVERERRQERIGAIPNAFSEHRRVTVEDVFWQAGKFDKDGKWREGAVPIIGSGLGQRICPPRAPKPEKPHHKEMVWVMTIRNSGSMSRELMLARDALDVRFIRQYMVIAFYDGKFGKEVCRITNNNGKMDW